MKQRLSKLILPALLLSFCFAGTSAEKAGVATPIQFPALQYGKKVYSFDFEYTFRKKVKLSKFIFYLNVKNKYGAGAVRHDIDDFEVTNMELPLTVKFPIEIDYDLFAREKDFNSLYITVKNDPYAMETYLIKLNYPTYHNIDIEEEDGSYSRPADGWYESFSGDDTNQDIVYEWTGFAGDFLDPKYMLFPFKEMKIRMRDRRGKIAKLPMKKAVLEIYDTENFDVGVEKGSFFNKRREVELDFSRADSSSYLRFRSKEKIIYSPDYRTVRTDGKVYASDHVTQSIFLPPVKNGEIRTTKFVLRLSSLGEKGRDNITYAFTITQTHNYVGSYPVSEYYVEEC